MVRILLCQTLNPAHSYGKQTGQFHWNGNFMSRRTWNLRAGRDLKGTALVLSLSLTWHWTDTLEPDGRFVLRMNQETSSLCNTNSSNKGPDTAILVTAFLVFIRIFSSQTWHLQIYVRYLSFKNNEVVIWKTVTFECGIINQNLESATQTGSINFRPKRQQVWFFGKIIKKLKKAGIHEILELPFG